MIDELEIDTWTTFKDYNSWLTMQRKHFPSAFVLFALLSSKLPKYCFVAHFTLRLCTQFLSILCSEPKLSMIYCQVSTLVTILIYFH